MLGNDSKINATIPKDAAAETKMNNAALHLFIKKRTVQTLRCILNKENPKRKKQIIIS
jgi:hypothetical protein